MKIRNFILAAFTLLPISLNAQSFGIYFLGGEILQYGGTNGDFGNGINGFYARVPGATDLTFDNTTALGLADSGLSTIKSFTYTQLIDGAILAPEVSYMNEGAPSKEPISVGEKVIVIFTDALSVDSIGYKNQIGVLESPTFISSLDSLNLLIDSFSVQVGTIGSLTLTYIGEPPDLPDILPTPTVISAAMRPGTTIMDIVFRVDDPGDLTVKVRPLAFADGVRSFANVIRPTTFVDGTDANIGDSVPTNVEHTLSWNVAADWDIDLGNIKFEILCRDDGGLLPFEWITIPTAGGEPEMTISKNAPTDAEVLDAFFWQYADGDPGLDLTDGIVSEINGGGILEGMELVNGSSLSSIATPYILKQMNLAAADRLDINYALSARADISDINGWHALDQPWEIIDSLVFGWGYDSAGGPPPPSGLFNVTAISAGTGYSLALLSDGTVIGWGSDISGQATPPVGLSNVTAISAGTSHSLALLSDGTVIGWGGDISGQATPPVGLSNVTAISAGTSHSLALLSDGTVIGWGSDNYGQATPPSGLSNVTAISAGQSHSLALLENGTVVGWGWDSWNQASPPGISNVLAIAAGLQHSLALLDNKTVVGWGRDTDSQRTPPSGLSGVTAIAAGTWYSLALLGDGTVVGWGDDEFGQATPLAGLSSVTAIDAGSYHTLVISKATNP